MQEIFCFFSKNILNLLKKNLKGQTIEIINQIEEIRIRSNGTVELRYRDRSYVLSDRIKYEDILETLQIICENSIYSYQNEICNGYITVKGGHRVGISGNCVIEMGKVINIKYISSLNFRIARQVIGCSNKILRYVLDLKNNTIYNTLIISPPGVRKNYDS